MDTARQVIRWALPAWVACFFWILFISVTFLICDRDQRIYIELLTKMQEFIVPLGVATIPMGFLIYQVYYWLYWYAPIPYFIGRFAIDPVDRGKEILAWVEEHVDFGELFGHSLNPTEEPYKRGKLGILRKDTRVMRSYRENWHLSDSAWYLALADERCETTAELLEKRNQLLGDIYHSLGASYTALTLAFVAYLFLFAYVTFIELPPGLIKSYFNLSTRIPKVCMRTIAELILALFLRIISVLLNCAIFVAIFRTFKGGRMASFDALLSLKRNVITNVLLNRPMKVSCAGPQQNAVPD
jgi:hypothetical protein